MRPLLASFLLASAVAPWWPTDAMAGTLTVSTETATSMKGESFLDSTFRYDAPEGEANRLTISVRRGELLVRDTAGVVAGPGCVAASPIAASCRVARSVRATVELGDGSDQSTTDIEAAVDGGEGDDLIRSGGGSATGAEGNDRLVGTGDGVYFDGGAGADLIAGGPGYDSVDYGDRAEAVVVDLDGSADDGQAGEGDNVTPAVERVETGSGDDVLIGGRADNPLSGGPGADRIVGGGGRDDLDGGPGDDFIDGGDGTDFLYGDSVDEGAGRDELLGGAGRDQIVAGPGSDRLVGGGEIDKLYPQAGRDSIEARDAFADSVFCRSRDQTSSGTAFLDARDYVEACSDVDRRGSPAAVLFQGQTASSFYRRGPTIAVGCPGDVARRCVGSLRIYVRGRLAGQRGFRLARGDHNLTTNVRYPFRRLLARNRVRRLDVLISARSDGGEVRRQRTRFLVR